MLQCGAVDSRQQTENIRQTLTQIHAP